MTHLRYPDSDPYYPGVVVPLQPGEERAGQLPRVSVAVVWVSDGARVTCLTPSSNLASTAPVFS